MFEQTNTLWLSVKSHRKRGFGFREFLPFQIIWSDKKLVPQAELAMLFPVGTYHVLKQTARISALPYFAEGHGHSQQRIVALKAQFESPQPDLLNQVAACLKPYAKSGLKVEYPRLYLEKPMMEHLVHNCAAKANLKIGDSTQMSKPYLKISQSTTGYIAAYTANKVTLTCPHNQPQCQPCELPGAPQYNRECVDNAMTIDVNVHGYREGFIYTHRDKLQETLQNVAMIQHPDGTPALNFHPSYKNSLDRFSFMQAVLDVLTGVFALFFSLFIAVLLYIQMNLVIENRKHYYGIFLCKGLAWQELYYLVGLQILTTFALAVGAALAIVMGLHWVLAWGIGGIKARYQDTLDVVNLDVLPLLWGEYLLLSGVILGFALVIAVLLIRNMQRRCRGQPAHLLKSA